MTTVATLTLVVQQTGSFRTNPAIGSTVRFEVLACEADSCECLGKRDTVGFSNLLGSLTQARCKVLGVAHLTDVATQSLDLAVEAHTNVDPFVRVRRAPEVYFFDFMWQQAALFVRRELQPIARGWVHRIQSRGAHCSVVRVVDAAVGIDRCRIVGTDDARADPPNFSNNCFPKLEGRGKLTILEVEKSYFLCSNHGGGSSLLSLAYLDEPLGGHLGVMGAFVTTRADEIINLSTLAGPACACATTRELGVIGVSPDDENANWLSRLSWLLLSSLFHSQYTTLIS